MRTPTQAPARHRRAFTLIELVVVILILTVLAGIGAVAYNQFVADAHTASLKASAVRISEAIDAAAAKADLSPQQEVDALWTAGGKTPNGFLTKLGVTYTGTVTYTAATGDGSTATAATVSLQSHAGDSQQATVTLPNTLSSEATISYSDTTDPSNPAEPTGPTCTPAPAPMPGCEIAGVTSATDSAFGTTPGGAVDGNPATYWDGGGPKATWTDTWDDTYPFDTVTVAAINSNSGADTYTVNGQNADGTWTQIGLVTVNQPAGKLAYWTIPVTDGSYTGIQLDVSADYIWATVNEVSLAEQ